MGSVGDLMMILAMTILSVHSRILQPVILKFEPTAREAGNHASKVMPMGIAGSLADPLRQNPIKELRSGETCSPYYRGLNNWNRVSISIIRNPGEKYW